jgi:hypothetical protein
VDVSSPCVDGMDVMWMKSMPSRALRAESIGDEAFGPKNSSRGRESSLESTARQSKMPCTVIHDLHILSWALLAHIAIKKEIWS